MVSVNARCVANVLSIEGADAARIGLVRDGRRITGQGVARRICPISLRCVRPATRIPARIPEDRSVRWRFSRIPTGYQEGMTPSMPWQASSRSAWSPRAWQISRRMEPKYNWLEFRSAYPPGPHQTCKVSQGLRECGRKLLSKQWYPRRRAMAEDEMELFAIGGNRINSGNCLTLAGLRSEA